MGTECTIGLSVMVTNNVLVQTVRVHHTFFEPPTEECLKVLSLCPCLACPYSWIQASHSSLLFIKMIGNQTQGKEARVSLESVTSQRNKPWLPE